MYEMDQSEGSVSEATNFKLAKKVFRLTHDKNGAITRYLDAVATS